MGADGAVVASPGSDPLHVPAMVLDPVDTTGAGDAFCGAMAAELAAGTDLMGAVRRAVEVAGRSTLIRGAQLTSPLHGAT